MKGRKMNKNTGSYVFFGLILPYACVLLVPILIWLFSNFYVIHKNEQKNLLLMERTLENSINSVDSGLQQVQDVIYRMSQNTVFSEFCRQESIGYLQIFEYKKMFASYFIENGLLDSLSIHSNISGITLDVRNFYRTVEDFVRAYTPDASSEAEALNEVEKTFARNGYGNQQYWDIDLKKHELELPYTRTLPLERPDVADGSITALINVGKLLSAFDSVLEEDFELYVLRGEQTIVMAEGTQYQELAVSQKKSARTVQKIKSNGEKLYHFTLTSSQNHWEYHVFVKRALIMRDMTFANNILHLINILAFVLGLFLCGIFTYGRNKSYLKIMGMLGIEKKKVPIPNVKTNEFEFWKPYIGNLVEENRQIREDMDKLSENSDYRLLHMLLTNTDNNEKDLIAALKKSNMDLTGPHYFVLVLRTARVYNLEGESNKNIFLSHVLEEFFGDVYLHVVDNRTMAVLFNVTKSAKVFSAQLENQLRKMNLEVFYRYHMEVSFGAGNTAESLHEIAAAYRQAMDVISYNWLTGENRILFYRELPQKQTMYYYPLEEEDHLLKAISCAKQNDALRVLNHVYAENFDKRVLSAARIEELMHEIYSTLHKISQIYFSNEEQIHYRLEDFTIKSFFEYARDFVLAACDNVQVNDVKSNHKQFNDIVGYIESNYNNSDLSLDMLAELFEVSDKTYISKLFKKYLNTTFLAYLEQIRMTKACELLLSHRTVKEVAEEVGYLSDMSFRRAFKKRYGMSPKDYVSVSQNE